MVLVAVLLLHSTRVTGNVLVGFVIGEIKVLSFFECVMSCTIGVNCLSLNILSSDDGSLVCQLNNAMKENATRYQFVPYEAGEYVSFTVRFLKFITCTCYYLDSIIAEFQVVKIVGIYLFSILFAQITS